MREILFRAKAINRDRGKYRTSYKNGDWVYGLITRMYDERFGKLPAEMRNTDGVNEIEVDYKTIGQFTGLTDRNGNKIFEGDIVQAALDGRYYSVEYITDYEYAFNFVDLERGYTYSLYDFNDVIVIGNIHDNPELLK
jgi:uncharacterized phage protein (TIGR01671 family)